MIKRFVDFLIKKRAWIFFISCFFVLLTILYLHGSVYRFIRIVNGERELPRDARSAGVFKIYLIISLVTIFISIVSLVPYLVCYFKGEKKENIFFILFISFLLVIIVTSLIVLGVAYV